MSGAGLDPFPGVAGRRQVHLVGFMGSGKSTVGRLLARRLVWNFLDLDVLIARHTGKAIAEIFAQDGEDEFRGHEQFALRQAVQKPSTVLALGGGTPISAENRRVIQGAAVTVWLRCPMADIVARLGPASSARPLWDGGRNAGALLAAREPVYAQSDHVVDAVGTPAEVAVTIEAILRGQVNDGR